MPQCDLDPFTNTITQSEIELSKRQTISILYLRKLRALGENLSHNDSGLRDKVTNVEFAQMRRDGKRRAGRIFNQPMGTQFGGTGNIVRKEVMSDRT